MTTWPLFGLAVRTPRLELRYVDDALLDALATVREVRPFAPGEEPIDGVDSPLYAESPVSEQRFMQGEWRARARTSPDWWHLSFAVLDGDEVVGQQNITGPEFRELRTVSSFSYVARHRQGQGVGKEMRAAVLHLAFAGLGAERAESDAFDDNPASQAVTRALGYEANGSTRATRPSGGAPMSRFLLTRERWEATRRDDIELIGIDAARSFLGL